MKLLLIGLDGVSANMIDRFDVKLDYLDTLQNEGVSGDLRSVDPPTTYPAWTSFATGLDPSSHGVRNMVIQNEDYSTAPVDVNISDPAIYDFLEKSTFINLQGSYDRVPVAEGTSLVSGKLSPDKEEAIPAHLRVLSEYDDYKIFVDEEFMGSKTGVNPDKYVSHLKTVARSRFRFARAALEKEDPKVGYVLFSALDWLGHYLTYADSETEAREWYNDHLNMLDEFCADLAKDTTNVMIISDHGFEPKTHLLHINEWLADEGYLAEPGDDTKTSTAIDLVYNVMEHSNLLQSVVTSTYDFVAGFTDGIDAAPDIGDIADVGIDHANSTAWDVNDGCIYLNDDRFPNQMVDPDNRDQVVNDLINDLSQLSTPDGTPIFREILPADEVYVSSEGMTPDIIVRPAPHMKIAKTRSTTEGYISPDNQYNHRYDGIIMANGPLFEEEAIINDMSITDVLPTVLHALDRPLSPNFDGDVRTEMLSTSYDTEVLSPDDIPVVRTLDNSRSKDQKEIVSDRLEHLGYI
jgi:predicted AlkP superfamily phosphohydrolase/phosphomutase